MRIALDALGGDYAPDPNIDGAIAALEANPDIEVDLVGDPNVVMPVLEKRGGHCPRLHTVPAEGFVGMDEKPTEALRKKPNCSIAVCWKLMAERSVDAVVSAGNTGAVVAAGMRTRLYLKGVKRPGIAVVLPNLARQIRADGCGREPRRSAGAPLSVCPHGRHLCPEHARHRGSADWPDQHRQRRRQGNRSLPRNARLFATKPSQGSLRRQRGRSRFVSRRGGRSHLRRFRGERHPQSERRNCRVFPADVRTGGRRRGSIKTAKWRAEC